MKTFECFWGDGYRADDGKSILAYHDQDFFTVDRGYDLIDIERLLSIPVGEVMDFNCITGEHWIRRMS